MRVVVTGAAGFIGGRLASALIARGHLDGRPITELVLVDQAFPDDSTSINIRRLRGDVRDPRVRQTLFEKPIQAFFHLAATLTAEAERDFEKGIEVNTVGLLSLLDDCRKSGHVRFIFSSSMAAFGGQLPDIVHDELPQRPTTSYGVQKVIAELLLDDYTRRGFLDGRVLRLPVVLLRPTNSAPALSGFISAIVREPLAGRPVVCPFDAATRMPVSSVGGRGTRANQALRDAGWSIGTCARHQSSGVVSDSRGDDIFHGTARAAGCQRPDFLEIRCVFAGPFGRDAEEFYVGSGSEWGNNSRI